MISIRDYSEDEYYDELEEYFGNSDLAAPDLANSDEELIKKMKDASIEYLSLEDMKNINNSDVGDILNAKEREKMLKIGKERAKFYERDWDSLERSIKNSIKVPPPIIIRDKNGKLHLMAGNTRLMVFAVYGKKLPVKIIDYNNELNFEAFNKTRPLKEDFYKK